MTIAREAIHRVRHIGDAPAVTLHAYSPPLDRVGTYEVAEDGALLRHPRDAEVPLEVDDSRLERFFPGRGPGSTDPGR